MDLASSCKNKLQHLRIKELKDVLTQLGISKQGKKQDLIDRILAIVADDQVSKMRVKRHPVGKEQVARLVDDTYRKMQISGATDLATILRTVSDSTPVKPKEEIDDFFQPEIKIRCLCARLLQTESMVQCADEKCCVWQHIGCVIIPEKPMEGIPVVPFKFYCELCRLNRADPFWLTVAHPLYPVKLMTTSLPTDGANPVQGVESTFQLTREDKDLTSKPEYDVQAWCMLLNDKVIFRMQWPQYADLQINGVQVRAINRPCSQLLGASGRDDGPVITPFTIEGINKISLAGYDARFFCLGVRIVKQRNLQQILNIIPKESDGEQFEDALARVCRCVGGGAATHNADNDSDLEVVADSFTISLRCPMSGSRIKIAGRFKPCAHLACFDLETFVEMQQRSRKWQCPICLKNYSLEHVIIDPYFNRITSLMRSCGEDATEIEVKPDGSWHVKGDSECGDLRQWHSPDGSLCISLNDVKPKPDALKPVKLEGTGLKLGIRKNSNGVWEVSKHEDMNTISCGERLRENLMSNDPKVIPISRCATSSGRDVEDLSVNQSANGNFDFSSNAGVEPDSMGLNFGQTHGVANKNSLAPVRDADVIVLSDSDDENANLINPNQGQMDAGGINFCTAPHGLSDSFQEDPAGIGAGGSPDLFTCGDDDFPISMWPLYSSNQAGPSFQLFGSDAGMPDPLVDLQHNSMNLTTSMSGYSLAPAAAMNPNSFVLDPSTGHSNNHDLNDGLVDNPLAFGGDDPSRRMFLPTRPSGSSVQASLRRQEFTNGIQTEDWISLRLGGGGGGWNHGESTTQNGFNSEYLHANEGAMQSLAETASLFPNDDGSDKTRHRSVSPFSFPQQKRSVKPRLLLSIDPDSE